MWLSHASGGTTHLGLFAPRECATLPVAAFVSITNVLVVTGFL
jgi:hypothetical protein